MWIIYIYFTFLIADFWKGRGPMKRNNALSLLSDEELIKIYTQAMSLELDDDFIELIKAELVRRGICF
ncbi:sporulation inhibitor sda domain protein [Aneurinibacillus aneurinilyticus ATCC 12856]|jgi:hypothetical protein|uniref:Sporulation inhibitor sda domain protein n=2 Tax=Aneurinibacillus aneurinilyticus TaxID=1391 RepID=U1WXM6_ANEAE|nr:sporulation inhibitor sda domain protein [Aneurinibacillus aneurinilyticus ATCC 12856]